MRALSIRQPFAELILQGVKTIEFRTKPTKIIGERFYIYASKKKFILPGSDGAEARTRKGNKVWSQDLAVPNEALPPWMMPMLQQLILRDDLPTGVIVGTAIIEQVTRPKPDGYFHWHLTDVERATKFRKPRGHPQPVWFEPF